jgi:hypothetical protein
MRNLNRTSISALNGVVTLQVGSLRFALERIMVHDSKVVQVERTDKV